MKDKKNTQQAESDFKPGVWYTEPECCVGATCGEDSECELIEVSGPEAEFMKNMMGKMCSDCKCEE